MPQENSSFLFYNKDVLSEAPCGSAVKGSGIVTAVIIQFLTQELPHVSDVAKKKREKQTKKKMCFLSICDFLHSRYSRKPKYYCNAQWKRWGHCLKPSLVAFTEKTHVFQNRCVPRVLNSGILRWWTNSLVNIASLKSACKTRGTMAWAPYWHLTCGSEGNSPTMWGTIPHTKRIVLQWLS